MRAALLFIVALCTGLSARAATVDERFLDGLRERRLFGLAEKFCRDRLARDGLDDATRVRLTIELARTKVEEALQSPPAERGPLWEAARDVTDRFEKEHPHDPRLVQVQVQRGLIELARGEIEALEAELTGGAEPRVAAARDHLRSAIDLLRAAEEDVSVQLRRQQMGRKPDPEELNAAALRALVRNIRYQLARALSRQGRTYPADSADRTNSLSQAVEILRTLGDAEADPADPVVWPSRLDSVVCYRLLGHSDAATRELQLIDELSPPPAIAAQAQAERIRLALAARDLAGALAVVNARAEGAGPASAELELAALETYLAAWRAASEKSQKSEVAAWQTKASAAVREIDRNFGPYWRRRGEALFAEQVAANPATTDVVILARAAEGFYRAGQIDEALASYDRAAEQAREAGDDAKSFELAYAAAAIEQQRKHYAAAAERFRRVALGFPKLPRAAEAHLLGVYDAGQAARGGAADARQFYGELLDEHLSKFADGATAGRAHLWRARLHEHERRWEQAIDEYDAIAAGDESAREAAVGLARAYQARLAQLQASNQPTAATALAAASAIGSAAALYSTEPADYSTEQLQAVTALAAILLEYADAEQGKAEKLLNDALAHSSAADEQWKIAARGLLVYALAAQDRAEDAERELEALSAAGPAALASLVKQLDALGEAAPAARRRSMAGLELRALELLARQAEETKDAGRQQQLALARARALSAAGRADEAAAAFKELAATRPRDGDIQEAYAASLSAAKDPAALAAWQQVEAHSRSGTPRWMRAKLQEALCYERAGDKVRAAGTVRAVQTLYPALEDEELKGQFLEVLERCR